MMTVAMGPHPPCYAASPPTRIPLLARLLHQRDDVGLNRLGQVRPAVDDRFKSGVDGGGSCAVCCAWRCAILRSACFLGVY